MRSLKFKLRRQPLNQIYIYFLRQILEYASVVWDNCTQLGKDSLEKYNTKPHVSLLVQPDQYQLIICKKKSVGYRSLIGENIKN